MKHVKQSYFAGQKVGNCLEGLPVYHGANASTLDKFASTISCSYYKCLWIVGENIADPQCST